MTRPVRILDALVNLCLCLAGLPLISCGIGALPWSGGLDRHSGRRAQRKAAIAQISEFQTAIEHYQRDHGRPPTAKQGLAVLLAHPRGLPERRYLDDTSAIPRDPWGNDYIYRSPGTDGTPFEILSYGADGRPGGSGWDTDITSRNLGRQLP